MATGVSAVLLQVRIFLVYCILSFIFICSVPLLYFTHTLFSNIKESLFYIIDSKCQRKAHIFQQQKPFYECNSKMQQRICV